VSAATVSAAAESTGAAAAVSTATESVAASVFFSPQDAKVTIPATKAKANNFFIFVIFKGLSYKTSVINSNNKFFRKNFKVFLSFELKMLLNSLKYD
jgi:hypothetical protein